MVKAIIFDFFGVIGKSTHTMMRERFNLNSRQLQMLKNLHKLLDYEFIGSKKYLQSYAKVAGVSYDEVYKVYEDSKTRFSRSDEILNYINKLKNTYKIALLSNVAHQAYDEFINPIADYFDVIITSYETKWAKPEMKIYEICAQRLDVDVSECVMIDDTPINCEGAVAAGMQAIQYKDFEQFKNDLSKLLTK